MSFDGGDITNLEWGITSLDNCNSRLSHGLQVFNVFESPKVKVSVKIYCGHVSVGGFARIGFLTWKTTGIIGNGGFGTVKM